MVVKPSDRSTIVFDEIGMRCVVDGNSSARDTDRVEGERKISNEEGGGDG